MKSLVVFAVLTLLNFYIASRVRGFLAMVGKADLAVKIALGLFFVMQLTWPLLELSSRSSSLLSSSGLYALLIQTSFVTLGILSCLLIYLLLADIFFLALTPLSLALNGATGGRIALALVIALTTINVTVGLGNAGKTEIVRIDLPIKNLPDAFDGVTIAQITDTHLSHFLGRAFMQEVVDKVAALIPDIIVITGDIADGRADNMQKQVAPLQKLHAPLGKFYVTGNHEYYWDSFGWPTLMKTLGYQVLMNQYRVIEKDGAQLVMAGVPDPTSIRMKGTIPTNLDVPVVGAPKGVPTKSCSHTNRGLPMKPASLALQRKSLATRMQANIFPIRF